MISVESGKTLKDTVNNNYGLYSYLDISSIHHLKNIKSDNNTPIDSNNNSRWFGSIHKWKLQLLPTKLAFNHIGAVKK